VVIAFTSTLRSPATPNEKRQPKLPFPERAARHAYAEACLAALPPSSSSCISGGILHPAGRIDDLLLARVERVAGRADFHVQSLAQRGAGRERVPQLQVTVISLYSGWILGSWCRPCLRGALSGAKLSSK